MARNLATGKEYIVSIGSDKRSLSAPKGVWRKRILWQDIHTPHIEEIATARVP